MADPLRGLWAIYLGILLATLATQAIIGYWVYTHHRDRDGATWFLYMLVPGAIWVFFIFVFLLPIGRPLKTPVYMVAEMGAITSFSTFVAFVSTYTGTEFHRNRLVAGILVGNPLVYLLLAPTNGSHHLLFTAPEFFPEPFPHLYMGTGPVWDVQILLITAIALYADYQMIRYLLSTRRRPALQLALFTVGAFSITAVFVVDSATSIFPVPGFSHAVLGKTVFYAGIAAAVFEFSFLDVKPVARNNVIENLRDPVVVLDADRRVVDFNRASTHIWDDIGERLHEPFDEVCPSLAEAVTLTMDDEDATSQLTLPFEDEERHYSVTVSEVAGGRDGAHGWYSILLRDITELERSRWQLEKQNERLDQVASTISHDLRNPINVADGHAGLLKGMLDDGGLDSEEVPTAVDYLDKTLRACDRMDDIIEDILTIAREGKTVEETERVSLEEVARDAWETVDTKSATLEVAGDRTFRADRSKLMTILENLFRNALDHGPDTVTIEVGTDDGGFYVADDGPGIPETHHDSIFEYGYTTSQEGTGLGLSIVRTMAESHGWTVEHDAGYEDGTRFVFEGVTAGEAPAEASPRAPLV